MFPRFRLLHVGNKLKIDRFDKVEKSRISPQPDL